MSYQPPPQYPGSGPPEYPSSPPQWSSAPAGYPEPAQYHAAPDQYPPAMQYAPVPPPPRGYNGFAIASAALGLIGGVLLSVIFGIVGLVQVRKTGQAGKGMAITGLVLSGLWVVGIGVAIAIAIASEAGRDTSGAVNNEGSVTTTELRPGDCVREVSESKSIYDVPAVPCSQRHQGEVFAVFTLPAGNWPGEQAVVKKAEDGCSSRLAGYSKRAAKDENLQVFFIYPADTASWRRDRSVTCLVTDRDGKLTGSLRD
jgi:hypothetical protein